MRSSDRIEENPWRTAVGMAMLHTARVGAGWVASTCSRSLCGAAMMHQTATHAPLLMGRSLMAVGRATSPVASAASRVVPSVRCLAKNAGAGSIKVTFKNSAGEAVSNSILARLSKLLHFNLF